MYRFAVLIVLVFCVLFLIDAIDIPRYSPGQVLAIATDFSPHCKLEVVN